MFEQPDLFRLALQICADCPVQAPCRQLGRGVPGVWGGRVNNTRTPRQDTTDD